MGLVSLIAQNDDRSKENEISPEQEHHLLECNLLLFSQDVCEALEKDSTLLGHSSCSGKDQLCKRGHLHITHPLPVASLLVIFMKPVD